MIGKSTPFKGIGILPGYRPQYIDHLVPLCHLMQIPILVTDARIQGLIQTYYPPVEIIESDPEDSSLDEMLQDYEIFFYVEFSRQGNKTFQFHEYVTRKKARAVMSLHGNPDKYGDQYWIERLADEDIVLAYGPQLLALLEQKGVRKKPILSGNYRLEFYQTHKSFFDSRLPFAKKKKKTVLYAPTWASHEKNSPLRGHYSPFFNVYKPVFEHLSEKYDLFVKLHPLMIQCMPDEVERVKESYPEICFLSDFPPIYPLLNQIDLYLGDYSSIGYDFLYFDRPLFFLGPSSPTPLQTVGRLIKKEDLPHLFEETTLFERNKLYRYAFGETKPLSQLKEELQYALQTPQPG